MCVYAQANERKKDEAHTLSQNKLQRIGVKHINKNILYLCTYAWLGFDD